MGLTYNTYLNSAKIFGCKVGTISTVLIKTLQTSVHRVMSCHVLTTYLSTELQDPSSGFRRHHLAELSRTARKGIPLLHRRQHQAGRSHGTEYDDRQTYRA